MKRDAIVAIIRDREGRFLIGKRNLNKAAAPGYWVPVSGKLEEGETQEEALVREVYEEIGVRARPIKKVGEIDTHDGKFRLHW